MYESSSSESEFKMNLAQVTTNTSSITDLRKFRSVMSKEILTTSGSRMQRAGFMFAILVGGGGGGSSSTGTSIAGGQGGGVTVDYPLHTMMSTMTWTIGAGGTANDAGGTTSLTTNEQTLTAVGGEAGRSFASNEARQAPFRYLGYDFTGSIVTHAPMPSSPGQIFVYSITPILSAGAKYVTDSNAVISIPQVLIGTRYGFATSSAVRTNLIISNWTYGIGGGTNSAGNAGAILLYTFTI